VLEGLEAVRKRPGMYIGSTDARGLMHCLWELIDNSVDEAVAGHGSDITVTLHPDGSVSVADLGRGVPVDIEPRTGLTGVELVFTKLHAGGKFGAGSYATSGGLHGVGASVVNALSQRLDVEVDREGKTWAMSFHRGEPGIFHDVAEASPTSRFEAFEKTSELRVVGKAKKGVTGTRVRFWPDPEIFGGKVFFGLEELTERSRQTAYLVPGLFINLDDATGDTPVRTTYSAAGGLADFLEFLAPDQPVVGPWHFSGDGQFEETVPVLDDSGKLVSKDLVREVHVDVVLQWGTGYDTVSKSFVNIIQTPKGGTHQQGFDAGLVKTLRAEIEKNARKLKVGKDKVEKEDIVAGLTVIVAVRVPEPQFEGQTKEVLGTPGIKSIVSAVVATGFAAKFASTKREDKAFSQIVQEKIVAEMKTRLSARALKETQRRKNALEASTLPTKLVDCRTKETEGSELFIVEGDSALGTAKLARDSEHQALLPIRGKILNTQKASVQDMLDNAECAAIIQVVGAGSGRTFDLSQARYGKIIIMSDADVDGAHIRTLLLTLFFRYMRPLVEAGRVYAAVPPLHRVVVNGRGKTPPEIIYTYSEDELNTLLASLSRAGKTYREPIQRYKGLGEMDADQLAETTMNRGDRTLRRVRVSDAEAAATVFELLMGNDVAPRRDFIVSGPGVSRDRIDA
jgi:DNA gyrase subunit B